MVMILVNIHEVKSKLSEYIEAAIKGEHVVICKRNQPVVELRAIVQQRTEPRPMGLAQGLITIPESFFEPLPDDWLDAIETTPVFPPGGARPSRIAETPAEHGAPKKPRRRKP